VGTGGPGNIVHIDNLYVKTINVKDNVNIILGQFVVIEDDSGFAVARPLVDADFSGADLFLDLSTIGSSPVNGSIITGTCFGKNDSGVWPKEKLSGSTKVSSV